MKKMSRVLGINIHQVRESAGERKKKGGLGLGLLLTTDCSVLLRVAIFAVDVFALGSIDARILVAKEMTHFFCFWFLYPPPLLPSPRF